MVKAGDIGKASKDFLKKDFFSANEVKISQGCCSAKNTTTFKLGEAVAADHKIELKTVSTVNPIRISRRWKIKGNIFKSGYMTKLIFVVQNLKEGADLTFKFIAVTLL